MSLAALLVMARFASLNTSERAIEPDDVPPPLAPPPALSSAAATSSSLAAAASSGDRIPALYRALALAAVIANPNTVASHLHQPGQLAHGPAVQLLPTLQERRQGVRSLAGMFAAIAALVHASA